MKKIILLAAVIYLLVLFYNKFLADTVEPFFKGLMGNVDFFGAKAPDYSSAAGN
ncbi:MAG: hypothetical protein ABH825_00625 [Candidatus Omnitrophota bacterium]